MVSCKVESDEILTLHFDKLTLHIVSSIATMKNLSFKKRAMKPLEEMKYILKEYILTQQKTGR